MQKYIRSQKGFTLVEVTVYMTLTVLLMSGIFNMLFVSLRTWEINTRKIEVQQTARIALDYMVRELRYAKKIDSVNKTEIKFTNLNNENIRIYVSNDHILLLRRENETGGGGQPITGENNVALSTMFSLDSDNRTVNINLTATDTFTDNIPRQSLTVTSSVVTMNSTGG